MVFNDDSQRKIDNIAEALKSNPAYNSYSIKSYCYDFMAGVHAIEIAKNGDIINLFLFYPWFKGEIESIAIYGYNLTGHYNAIKSSMTIFGLPVDSVDLESGLERFIDVHLVVQEYKY